MLIIQVACGERCVAHVRQHGRKNNQHQPLLQVDRQHTAGHRADGRRDLQEHAQLQVGDALLNIRRSAGMRCCDYRDNARR